MLAYIDGAYRGSSTDRAAMSDDVIRNQEKFIETDTGKLYFYDAENTQWVEFAPSGSGGGDTLVVTWNTTTGALDKTWQEIHDAMAAGRYVIIAHNDAEAENYATCTNCVHTETEYLIHAFTWHGESFGPSIFFSETANDYPVYD